MNIVLLETTVSDEVIFEYNIDVFYSVILNLPELYFTINVLDKSGKYKTSIATFDELKNSEMGSIFEGMSEEQQMAFLTPKYHPIHANIGIVH